MGNSLKHRPLQLERIWKLQVSHLFKGENWVWSGDVTETEVLSRIQGF